MGEGQGGWGDPLDLARDEILAGRPLLCVGEAVVLLHAVREAARVAGRYADLRVLWWDEPGDEEVVDGSTRRRPVDPGTEGRGADVLPGLTPSLDWVPVIDGVCAATLTVQSLVTMGLTTGKLGEFATPLPKRYTGLLSDFSVSATDGLDGSGDRFPPDAGVRLPLSGDQSTGDASGL